MAQCVKEYDKLLSGSFNQDGCTYKNKQAAWKTISEDLHAAFPQVLRTEKDCQKRWQAIQSSAKPRIAKFNEAQSATGKDGFIVLSGLIFVIITEIWVLYTCIGTHIFSLKSASFYIVNANHFRKLLDRQCKT